MLRILKENRIKLFHDLSYEEKIHRLIQQPYTKGRFYHVTDPSNLQSILRNGIIGEDIWVSKDEPHEEYNSGILLELDLKGFKLNRDVRWKDEAGTFVITEHIPPSAITDVFLWFDSVNYREDLLMKMVRGSVDNAKTIIDRL